MSLTVFPYHRKEPTGEIIQMYLSANSQHNNLFGIKGWRFRVWGSELLKSYGCSILASLTKTNISAEEEEIEKLEKELLLVKKDICHISVKLKVDEMSYWVLPVENALQAIRIAKKYQNGGVCIG
jgi:hypothetical protein